MKAGKLPLDSAGFGKTNRNSASVDWRGSDGRPAGGGHDRRICASSSEELRVGTVKFLFVFDRWRDCVLTVAGDKAKPLVGGVQLLGENRAAQLWGWWGQLAQEQVHRYFG
jgi:hypothetical protein